MKWKCKQKFAGNQNQAYGTVYENTVMETTNTRVVKAVHRDEHVPSLAQI